jgi:hypothetical protein
VSTPSTALATQTKIGLYGELLAFATRDHDVDGQPRRAVAWLEHRPTAWLRFMAALEYEHEGQGGHDFAMEQVFVEASPHPMIGVRAGLLLLPLGIVNQHHDPTTILTVDRPLTDQLIIPTTWRELGAGIFGELGPQARYEVDVVGGLDATGFSAEAPFWGARGNGHEVALHDAALTGRIELGDAPNGFAVGGGGYYGGASAGHPQLAGVTAGLAEADMRWTGGGADVRAEYAELFIVNSYRVNDYLGLIGQDAVPARGRGFYLQAGYDLLRLAELDTKQALLVFAGYENVNPRSKMSSYNYNPPSITSPGQVSPNARQPSPAKGFVRAGVVYRPRPVVALKVDVQIALQSAPPAEAAPSMTLPGAPGTPEALGADLAEAARGRSRIGVAAAFSF